MSDDARLFPDDAPNYASTTFPAPRPFQVTAHEATHDPAFLRVRGATLPQGQRLLEGLDAVGPAHQVGVQRDAHHQRLRARLLQHLAGIAQCAFGQRHGVAAGVDRVTVAQQFQPDQRASEAVEGGLDDVGGDRHLLALGRSRGRGWHRGRAGGTRGGHRGSTRHAGRCRRRGMCSTDGRIRVPHTGGAGLHPNPGL